MFSLKADVKTFADILQHFFQFPKQSLSFAGGGGDLLQIRREVRQLEKLHNWKSDTSDTIVGAFDFITLLSPPVQY